MAATLPAAKADCRAVRRVMAVFSCDSSAVMGFSGRVRLKRTYLNRLRLCRLLALICEKSAAQLHLFPPARVPKLVLHPGLWSNDLQKTARKWRRPRLLLDLYGQEKP